MAALNESNTKRLSEKRRFDAADEESRKKTNVEKEKDEEKKKEEDKKDNNHKENLLFKIHKTKKILLVKERLQVYYFLQNKIKVIYSLFTLALYPQLKYQIKQIFFNTNYLITAML